MIPKTAEQSLEQKFAKATGFYEKGKFDKANKIFRRIQRANPGIPEVLHMLGLIALKTDRAEDAVGHLESAVQSAPGSADLFGLLAGRWKRPDGPGTPPRPLNRPSPLSPAWPKPTTTWAMPCETSAAARTPRSLTGVPLSCTPASPMR